MNILSEENLRNDSIKDVAAKMMLAARTAPKARGRDNLAIAITEDQETIKSIANTMRDLATEQTTPSIQTAFLRDADNILKAEVLFIIGTKLIPLGMDCGLCGLATCQEKSKYPKQPCVFNTGDLGVALGSAVSVAMDHRVDNRVMFTVGMAVRKLGLLGRDVEICYGVPLSASGKNVFFDRK
ncbi:MAG: DUF2148 domain-containing protein [Gammaproteobacteria bacterium]